MTIDSIGDARPLPGCLVTIALILHKRTLRHRTA